MQRDDRSNERPVFVFLSHSGADAPDAKLLRDRLMSRFGHGKGFYVWLDKFDLKPGPKTWQEQIEEAIDNADAFLVLVGSRGIVNWVEFEVRLGLSKSAEAKIPFVPILCSGGEDSSVLPPFARQYHAILDPLNNPQQFENLVDALAEAHSGKPPPIEEPFVGLRAMDERDANLFFGREKELGALIDLLKHERLVAIVSDSGAGKSSLARAGLASAFRGGALGPDASNTTPSQARHVVVTRPGADPWRGLRNAVNAAAIDLGLDGDTRAGLRQRLTTDVVEEVVHALNCDLLNRAGFVGGSNS